MTINASAGLAASGSFTAVGGIGLSASADLGEAALVRATQGDDTRVTEDDDTRIVVSETSALVASADLAPFVGGVFVKQSGVWFPITPSAKAGGTFVPVLQAYARTGGRWFRAF